MIKSEAAEILNVPETACMDDVRNRFQEMYSDYQVRLTNAPTPALRKVYQRNLEQLRTAVETLFPGVVVAAPQDLPATEPVQSSRDETAPRPARSTTTTRASARVPLAASETTRAAGSKAFNLAVVAAGIFGAFALLFGILWSSATSDNKTLQSFLTESPDEQMAYVAKNEKVYPSLAQTFALLQNGQFAVCNDSASPIVITWIIASYRGKDGAFHTFNSKNYPASDANGNPTFMRWSVGADGSRKSMTMSKGGELVWDGSVLAYSLGVLYDGQEYVKGGTWSAVQGGCVRVHY